MHEDFGTIINRGFNSWVRNLNICIPFILNFFINIILYFFFFGLMGILLFTSKSGGIIDPASLPAQELYSIMWQGFMGNLLTSVFLIVVFLLLSMFVQAFFTAGAIGMAQKASQIGDTFISDMLISGSKNTSRLFLTSLLIALLLLAGMVFLVPGVFLAGDISGLIQNPGETAEGMGVLIIGILIYTLYLITVSIMASLAPYALVIDELKPLEALKTSFNFVFSNKLDVILIWIFYLGLTFLNSFIGEFIGTGSGLLAGLTYLVPIIILQPLMTIFWTRLYVSRNGKKLYNPLDLLTEPI